MIARFSILFRAPVNTLLEYVEILDVVQNLPSVKFSKFMKLTMSSNPTFHEAGSN